MLCPMTNGAINNCGNKAVAKGSNFTWQELATYNRRDNAHVAVHGKVYDVSSFIDKHPGGADQIALGAGRDISQVFECYHSEKAFEVIERFYVGELVSNEYPVFPPHGEFYRTLKHRVDSYFKANNIDAKYDPWMFVRYAFFLAFSFLCLFFVKQTHENMLLFIICSVLFGFNGALLALTFTHDASHFSITHKPWVWKLCGTVHDIFIGSSFFMWTHQHILGHHPYTNIDGNDPDIYTQNDHPYRIKHHQPWIPRYIYQHIYLPLAYCLLGPKTRMEDFTLMMNGRNSVMKLTIPTYSQLLQFYGGKFLHVNYRFVLLCFYIPLWKVLLFNLIAEVVGSYWLALQIQSSHVISEVTWPQPDDNNKVHQDWAELQVASIQDYATDSWFWSMFSGSINHQTLHHLFPGVIQSHYIRLSPILRETCKDFGVTYHYMPNFWQALGCHINHLKRLGQDDAKAKQP